VTTRKISAQDDNKERLLLKMTTKERLLLKMATGKELRMTAMEGVRCS